VPLTRLLTDYTRHAHKAEESSRSDKSTFCSLVVGVRWKWYSGTKYPSSSPISSTRYTPSWNCTPATAASRDCTDWNFTPLYCMTRAVTILSDSVKQKYISKRTYIRLIVAVHVHSYLSK